MGAYEELDSWTAYTSANLQEEALPVDLSSSLLGIGFGKSPWTAPHDLPQLNVRVFPGRKA